MFSDITLHGKWDVCVISGLRSGVNEICPSLGFYVAWNGSLSPTFRDKLSVPLSKVKKSKNLTP
jgi:hypothetical protein